MSNAWNHLEARRFTPPRLLLRVAVASLFLALSLSGAADARATARADPDIPLALREAVEKSLYRIRDYRSSNPAQGFGATFTDAGLHLSPRGPSAGSWQ
jgi:hypothetical protein